MFNARPFSVCKQLFLGITFILSLRVMWSYLQNDQQKDKICYHTDGLKWVQHASLLCVYSRWKNVLKVKVLINHWYWVQAQHMLASILKGPKYLVLNECNLEQTFTYLLKNERMLMDGVRDHSRWIWGYRRWRDLARQVNVIRTFVAALSQQFHRLKVKEN